jgi:FtsP/CotA-like multicopper oxidase with cupredoxin domain
MMRAKDMKLAMSRIGMASLFHVQPCRVSDEPRVCRRSRAMKLKSGGTIATVLALLLVASAASAQDSSIYVQCPSTTDLHPLGDGITCRHLVAGDGVVTMSDDMQKEQYIFSFAELPEGGPAPNSPQYPGWVMDQGTLLANAPAPTIEVDEDDELFLTLTNVGMAMRPDLFDPHSVHWHGFRNASSIFDGVPDSSISINMGASLTYYYNAKDAGTYMYHCHVEAAEHMQMGMLGSLYVRPRQNKCTSNGSPCPPDHVDGQTYVYNDGDGSTRYDVEYPLLIGSFDPDFHDASFNVQPLPFAGMRDRYFLLNGRGYPDTVDPNALTTEDPLGKVQESQPVSSLITASAGQRVLLRIANLSVTRFYTLGSSGIPMEVVGLDARLLRDGDGNNLYYKTNSLTLGGGQSADVILDTTGLSGTYFIYTTNLDQLANDAENFGGMMTEIRVN